MKRFAPEKIRNVALVGHQGSGKTTLAEALLHRAGAIARVGRVEDGSTVTDFDPEEQKRGQSLSLALAPLEWQGHKINLIDTPGYADFVGDVRAALTVADLAVFVVSAVEGVEVQTEVAWDIAEELNLPRLVFVNKLDRERSDFDAVLADLRDHFGDRVAPLELPIGQEAAFTGVADLLSESAYIYDGDDQPPRHGAVPADIADLEHEAHDTLVEGIVVADDDMLEHFLDGEVPSVEELEHTLAREVREATIFPVLGGSATRDIGVDRLADFICEIGPSPVDGPGVTVKAGDQLVPVAPNPDGEPLAFVFKTVADPYVGRLSLFKVLSGTVRPDDHLINSRTGADERLHGLFTLRGKEQEQLTELPAGDIGVVSKLTTTTTSDTLAPRGKPVIVPTLPVSEPVLAVAIVARSQADDDKLATALHRITEEDPGLVVERDDETHQTILRGAGELHLQITLERLQRKFGVAVDTEEVRVLYRETISTAVKAVEGKHKKQSGGHGQFGVCTIDVAPRDRGDGFLFVDKIVGGAIGRNFIPAVQRGVEEAMANGGVLGHPVVDVQVTLTDGKEHSVDSSEMAFRAAGRVAIRTALEKAGPVLLEPVSQLEVVVPVTQQGEVLGDLHARRGRVQGTEPDGNGHQVITALVPTSELARYAIDLRSLTGGRGRFHARHDHYDFLPGHLVDRVKRTAKELD